MLTQQFEIENHSKETKNRLSGWTVTIAVHALILLLLFFSYITPPNPPYEDNMGGMSVNYGTSDVGTGDQQQFTTVPVTVQQDAQPEASSQPNTSTTQENLETQDKEEAAVIESKKDVVKPKEKPNPDAIFKPHSKPVANNTPEPVKPKVDKNALFSPGAVGKPNKSKGDGEGRGQGDQGDPNGDVGSKNYQGGGTGNGPGKGGNGLGDGNVKLTGRKLRSRPPVKNPCETSRGKVVISISVNREGKVVDTKFAQSGSTSSDDCLIATARQAAMKYTFDANSTAAETQTGSIVFIFKED
jgi:outer membrane biosynthesis protein TonB